MKRFFKRFFIISFISVLLYAVHQKLAAQPASMVTIKVKDITPRFLAFYDSANIVQADVTKRWELWKKLYDFAAVPPTPQGDSIARRLLNDAWPKYPAAISVIKAGASGLTPNPQHIADQIATLLKVDKPVNITLLVYVGGFEGNAFTTAQDSQITTAIAIETPPVQRALFMTHEFTHAVHIAMGSFRGGWQRSIATIVLTEGLAMHVTQFLDPDAKTSEYVENRPGWFKEAQQKRYEILKEVSSFLHSDKLEDVMRFTMGKGSAGIEREAYFAGWMVVDYWLRNGWTYADIARIQETDMPEKVGKAIEVLLKKEKFNNKR